MVRKRREPYPPNGRESEQSAFSTQPKKQLYLVVSTWYLAKPKLGRPWRLAWDTLGTLLLKSFGMLDGRPGVGRWVLLGYLELSPLES